MAKPRSKLKILITAQIHAGEFVGSFVARAVAARLLSNTGNPQVAELLRKAEIWILPLLNPDGARRVWRSQGWGSFGNSRFTANGVDPNRNFPPALSQGSQTWNSGKGWPGSAFYRCPYPLSEPECEALTALCKREGFCAAINFHSFGSVVYMPKLDEGCEAKLTKAFGVFQGPFQSKQRHRKYRPIREKASAIEGQWILFCLMPLVPLVLRLK